MEKEVTIKIVGKSLAEDETITTIVPGNYYEKNGIHYLKFIEEVEDESVNNLYKFNDTMVHINKKGTTVATMEFKVGEDTTTNYITPYGIFLMEIKTKKIQLLVEERLISLEIEYTMSLQEGEAQKHYIVIEVSLRNED